jgi:RecA-family ATPase
MLTAEQISAKLRGRILGGGRYQANCPLHDGVNHALSLHDAGDGVILKCSRGCDPQEIAGWMKQKGWPIKVGGSGTKSGNGATQHSPAPQSDAPHQDTDPRLIKALRSVAFAKPGVAKLQAMRDGARSLAIPVRHGFVERADVVDRLMEIAGNVGLVAEVGEPVVADTIASGLDDFGGAEQRQAPPDEEGPLGPNPPPHEEQPNEQNERRVRDAPPPLEWLDMSVWDSQAVPDRQWTILNRAPANQAGLFSGHGGTGKSILELTKNVAHVAGKDWLGSMPEPGPAIYIGAEDEEDEIHRRLAAIARHYGLIFKDLIDGGLYVLCLLGQDATLCAATGKSGKVEVTGLYRRVYEAAGDLKPKNTSIDTLSRAFAGNEIDRVEVYGFAMHMQALAMVASGSVTVLSHPSLQGMQSGSGISGSTAWHNAFRFRHYLKSAKPENEGSADDGSRELTFLKNQYGPLGEKTVLRYQNGLFLPVQGTNSLDKLARQAKVDEVFLTLLHKLTSQNQDLSPSPSKTYASSVFAKQPEAAGIESHEFALAQQRLLDAGKVRIETFGPPSKERKRLVPV